MHGQHRLDHDVDVPVRRQRAIVAVERPVTCLVECFAGAQRLDAHARIRVAQDLTRQRSVQGAQPFECPQGVEPGEQIRPSPHDRLKRRRDRRVPSQHQQLLRRVAPPPIGMREVRDELSGRFIQHPRTRSIARHPVVRQPPDATVPDHFVQLVLV